MCRFTSRPDPLELDASHPKQVAMIRLASAPILACCILAVAARAGGLYVVTDLGALAPDHASNAYFLNGSGQVVGSSVGPGQTGRSFLWSPTSPNGTVGSMVDLGTLGGDSSVAYGINDAGQVCGYADDARGGRFAYVWSPSRPNGSTGAMTSLGLSLPANIGARTGINSMGQVAGGAEGDYPPQPFLWTPTTPNGGMGDAVFVGATYGYGNGINDTGQFTGFLGSEAFRWTPTRPNGATGTLEFISSDAGRDFSTSRSGIGINADGVVVGSYQPAALGGQSHAFIWTSDAAIDLTPALTTLSDAWAINNLGHTVGRFALNLDGNNFHAFLYDGSPTVLEPGRFHDLQTIVDDPDLDWQFIEASGINDVGQIVGYGKHQGLIRAFLLTPAIPNITEGVLVCDDGIALAGCAVTIEFWDSAGIVKSVTTTTDGSGYFSALLSCIASNNTGEHFVISTPCCAQSWTIPSTCCCGNLGTLTCASCCPFLDTCCRENDACPDGAIVENEICGLDANGGCNSTPPKFQQIACNDTICGAFWYDGSTRDTDWYEFTLSAPRAIAWLVWADVPVDVFVLSTECPPGSILATGGGTCPTIAATPCLAPGTYRLFVAPSFSAPQLDCDDLFGGSKYLAYLDCVPCGSVCEPGFGSCFAAHPWGGCDDANCCTTVCFGLPQCCTIAWDQACVAFAWTFGECQSGFMGCPDGGVPTVWVCEGGCRDGFATSDGPEPANNGNCPCASCIDFDVAQPDSCFQHTFERCWPSCPAGCGPFACGEVVGAFLEIGLKQVFGSPFPIDAADTLTLLDGADGYAMFDLTGPGSIVGGGGTILLDLANLPPNPGVTDMLATLCDGELTIELSDDVAVDYAWLTVIHCPCKFQYRPFHEGDADDGFTSPTAAHPDPSLVNHVNTLGGVVDSTYDTILCNRWFLESFDNLPSCTDAATLIVGLRKQCPPDCGQSDDTISLELVQQCGKVYGWSMPFSQLAAYMSTPTIGCTATTVLTLDLANLPPDANNVTNVVRLLLDGRLDILIEDDTAVDYIYLYPTVCDCCDGDVDGDGEIDGADLGQLLANWNGSGIGDLNGDGVVNGADLGLVLSAWGPCGG
ncbi:MAG: hypothetical protein U0575_14455 [Phycisphaerales bacterium]